jgi:hypothetical protein
VRHVLQQGRQMPQQLVIFPTSSYSRRNIHQWCSEWKIGCETDKKHPYCAMTVCGPPPGEEYPKCSRNEYESCFGSTYTLFYNRMVLTLTADSIVPPPRRKAKEKRKNVASSSPVDLWCHLAPNVLVILVLQLSLDDMRAVFLTCVKWSRIANSSFLWFLKWVELNIDVIPDEKPSEHVSYKMLVKTLVEAWKVHAPLCHDCVPGIRHRHNVDVIDPCVEIDCRGCKYGP